LIFLLLLGFVFFKYTSFSNDLLFIELVKTYDEANMILETYSKESFEVRFLFPGNWVLQVAADDIDEGENGEVAYTNILRDNNSLQIDNKSGWITVKTNRHIFDRENAKGKHELPVSSKGNHELPGI
jgi:hypothetical protein